MLKLRVLEILAEQNHTKYWLYKQMELSYQNFNRMVLNETSSIKFDNLEKLSEILNCSIDELFDACRACAWRKRTCQTAIWGA